MSYQLLIAKTKAHKEVNLLAKMANRHGLITGATGTGKTVTLQKIAESFSAIGVPVFMADVKGDLSGIQAEGKISDKLQEKLTLTQYSDWKPRTNPVTFWDVFSENGHPVRATISDMGPLLLSQLMELNEVQRGVLNIVFRIADEQGLLLLDLKDLRAMVQFAGDNAKSLQAKYGNISQASIGSIQRALLTLESDGGDQFFGEPMLNIFDLIRSDDKGGMINILAASKLYTKPKLYSMFLLWALSNLYENLPEVGDMDKPKLIFFFDEAHLLFNNAPNVLLTQIEQVVRLIRSKGVGLYFVTQNPADIPDMILGQLGNRVQHALRAFTPKDKKAVQVAASTMRANPEFNTEEAIMNLETGEALISFLDEKGAPSIVEQVYILAPQSRMGVLSQDERTAVIHQSPLFGRYEESLDRESAYEKLATSADSTAKNAKTEDPDDKNEGILSSLNEVMFGSTGPRGGKKDGLVQVAGKSFIRKLSNELVRGLLGGRKR